MKPYAALLGLSIAVNVGLVIAFVARPGLAPPAVRNLFSSPERNAENHPAARTSAHVTVEKSAPQTSRRDSTDSSDRAQLWAALDSDDLPTLIKRLRAAGFSRSVILGILNARLEERFADRLKALTDDVETTPYWKPDPLNSPFGASKYWEQYSQVYRERSRVLRQLLGDDSMAWPGTDPATAQRRQFGSIPKEKIELVQRINEDYAEMTSQVRAAMQGLTLPEDREKLALLEREKRADLAAVLTPDELEEYEMRTSPVTMRLRNSLSLMDASEAEYRAIFKVQQAFNDRINPTGGIFNSQMMEDRREAQKQMNEQLKAALSPERYSEYLKVSSNEYQQLHRVAQKENIPAETVSRAYSIRDAISAESVRIADDPALTQEQKRAALTALAQKGRTQILSTLGPGAGESYVQVAQRWLSTLERGSGVVFGPDGNPMPRTIVNPPRAPRP